MYQVRVCMCVTGVCWAICRLLIEQVCWKAVFSFQTRISDGDQWKSIADTVSCQWNWAACMWEHGKSVCLMINAHNITAVLLYLICSCVLLADDFYLYVACSTLTSKLWRKQPDMTEALLLGQQPLGKLFNFSCHFEGVLASESWWEAWRPSLQTSRSSLPPPRSL